MSETVPHDNDRIRVMVVAPGPETEGGITTVVQRVLDAIQSHRQVSLIWVAAHKSGTVWQKVGAAMAGVFRMLTSIRSVDIVHIHSSAYVSFVRKSIFYWIARLFGRPVVWHLHSPDRDFEQFFDQDGWLGRYARAILARVSAVVVLSPRWAALAARILPGARIQVIYNPIPDVVAGGGETPPGGSTNILYLAHLIPRKGYSHLVRAFADVADEYPDARLVFAGSGEVQEAQRLSAELGVENRVVFLGWIQDPARTEQLRNATIFVLPSFQEGLPMGLLEAMAYSIPVVTTPVGGIPDVIRHGENGLLVEAGNVADIAASLRRLLASASLREEMGVKGRESVSQFSAESVARDWLLLYESIAAANGVNKRVPESH